MVSKYTRLTLEGTINVAGAIDVFSDRLVRGRIMMVHVDYPAATVEVTLQSEEPVVQKVLELAAANTDRVFYPRVQACSNDGTLLNNSNDGTDETELWDNYVVFGRLRLVCASGTATQVVRVVVVYEEY